MRVLNSKHWPHKTSMPVNETRVSFVTKEVNSYDTNRIIWLKENIGVWGIDWLVVYYHKRGIYYFKDEADNILFLLRWS